MKLQRWIMVATLVTAGGCSKPSSLPLREPRLSMPTLTPNPSSNASPLQAIGLRGQSPSVTDGLSQLSYR